MTASFYQNRFLERKACLFVCFKDTKLITSLICIALKRKLKIFYFNSTASPLQKEGKKEESKEGKEGGKEGKERRK